MDFQTIRWDEADGVVTLTLNRPETLNAFNNTMLEELAGAVERVARSRDARVLVLTGAGRGFASGQDLKAYQESGSPDLGEHLHRYYDPLFERLWGLEKPTIAAVNGVAAGAGMSLAMACDFRVAADTARFMQAFVRIGLIPDSGSTYLLPRLVGYARALELAMLGDLIDAQTALAWGLVNKVVPAERLAEETAALARRLAEGPPKALGLIKRAIRRGAQQSFRDALEYEAWLQAAAVATEDHREGIAAFLEKRAPRFRGR
ncbi:MAG: enoyl-CoA hydratase/isomerase family protein [Actinomycetia bacterium]|nr:enoyl-CoA hydratase/isomerase family protein [Actinomycetes bacterium]